MAEKTELSVRVKADIDNLLQNMGKGKKSVQDFKDQLSRFKTSLDKATDPASVLRLNKAIESAQSRIKTISTIGTNAGAGFNSISSGANTAGQSLQNLGRIAQDAPFGFIGIQNNINPLIESFQRLKAESKATGTSLKSNIIGALAGGAGIGLAVSVVTGLLTVLAQKGFFNVKKAADEAAKATKEFNESLKEVESQGIATGLRLQGFVNIAKDQTLSITTRNEALKQANKIFGEHGDKLTLVNIATAAVTEQINKFTQATIQQSLATKFSDRAADLMIAQRDATKSYGVELAKLQALEKKQQFTVSATGEERITAAGAATDKQRIKVIALAQAYKGVTIELKDITSQLSGAQAQAADLFGQLGTKTKEKLAPAASSSIKDIRTVIDVIEEMRKKIALLNKEEIGFNTDNAEERYNTFLSAIKELNLKFGKSLDSDLLKGLFSEAKFAKVGFIVENGFAKLGVAGVKAFKDSIKDLKLEEVVPISFDLMPIEKGLNGGPDIKNFTLDPTKVEEAAALAFLQGQRISRGLQDGIRVGIEGLRMPELTALADDYKARLDNFNSAVKSITDENIVNTFSAIGTALGNAASGMNIGDIFGGFFKTILDSLGSGLQRLGVTMLAANKSILLVKATLGKVPGVGAAIGLIALGTIVKALSNNIKVPGFANGVQNFSGGLAVVGERGPELVNLPRGSDVIPNHALGGSLGGRQVFISESRLRGQDIVTAYKEASATNSRNGF